MYPKGILFDLDDTILSFSSVAEPTWRAVLRNFTVRYDLGEADILFTAIHDVSNWYWSDTERHREGRQDLNKIRRMIVSLALKKFNIDETIAWQIADSFSEKREEAIYIFDGARETLEHFQDQGVLLALTTNGESQKQRNKIKRFDLEKYFRAIMIEGEMGFGKPNEAVYRRALTELGIQPQEVWAVGDSLEFDVAGPQKLGIQGIWNDYAKKGLPPSSEIIPDRIIHSIAELIA